MNASYIRAKNTAIKMIKSKGAQFQWKRDGENTIDHITGKETPNTRNQTVWAVILPPAETDQYKGSDGTLNLSKVRKILIAPLVEFNPQPLDLIFYQGSWWLYENNVDLAPDGQTDVLFKGTIRRP